jgi:hypothetical protein
MRSLCLSCRGVTRRLKSPYNASTQYRSRQSVCRVQQFEAAQMRYFSTKTYNAKNFFEESNDINELLEKSCAFHADTPLFGTVNSTRTEYSWMTFRQFYDKVIQTRKLISSLGIAKDDKVGIISNNRWEWAAVAYGTLNLGGQIVPMYVEVLSCPSSFFVHL